MKREYICLLCGNKDLEIVYSEIQRILLCKNECCGHTWTEKLEDDVKEERYEIIGLDIAKQKDYTCITHQDGTKEYK